MKNISGDYAFMLLLIEPSKKPENELNMDKDLKSQKKYSIPVNILFTKKDINKIRNINGIPHVLFFLLVIGGGYFGFISGFIMLFLFGFLILFAFMFEEFSFLYVNGRIYFSHEGFYLKRRKYLKFISWDDVKNISFYQNTPKMETNPARVMYI